MRERQHLAFHQPFVQLINLTRVRSSWSWSSKSRWGLCTVQSVGYGTRQVAESKTYGTSQLCINYEAMEL